MTEPKEKPTVKKTFDVIIHRRELKLFEPYHVEYFIYDKWGKDVAINYIIK